MEKLDLTIVTISYKDSAGLVRTYQSLKHLVGNVEWQIVDGGGCEKTLNLLKELPTNDVVWTSEPDAGIYDAMNKGLLRSTRKYILFLNSGDELNNIHAADIYAAICKEFDVLFCGVVFSSEKGKGIIRYPKTSINYINHSLPGNQQGTIYNVKTLKTIGLPTNYKICGDYALACSLSMAGFAFQYSNLVISKFYLGGVSSTNWLGLTREAMTIQSEILRLPLYFILYSAFLRNLKMLALKVIVITMAIVR